MIQNNRLVYLHGSDSDSNSGKARLFRGWFPGMRTPDFTGSFVERMAQLHQILSDKTEWTLIGSSYGGLMGTVFASEHPEQVRKLVLLAPALLRSETGIYLDPLTGEPLVHAGSSEAGLRTVPAPTIIVHGTADDIVPLEPVRRIAGTLFTNLRYIVVEDGHRLGKAVHELDWNNILA